MFEKMRQTSIRHGTAGMGLHSSTFPGRALSCSSAFRLLTLSAFISLNRLRQR